MSKRALVKALEQYPFSGEEVSTFFGIIAFDQNHDKREGFRRGYEQAEKDTIERACNWLFGHLPIIMDYYDEDIHEKVDRSDFIKLFRTQMEGER